VRDPGEAVASTGRDRPDVSVVMPVYGSRPSLGRAIDAVLAQRFAGSFELVVVASADTPGDLADVPAHPSLSAVTHVGRLRPAAARNLGVARARADLLAFTDDDAICDPDWLARLVDASDGTTAVTGSIVNGTPASPAGTAEYLVDRLDLCPTRPRGPGPWHGDTANLLVPRDLWDTFGPFDEGVVGATDTILTGRLYEEGALLFEPAARVTHLNRTSVRSTLRVQYFRGRTSALLGRTSGPHPAKFLLTRPVLAPVALVARVFSIYGRCALWSPEPMSQTVLRLPLLVLVLGAWAAGLAVEGARLDRDAASAPPARPDVGDGRWALIGSTRRGRRRGRRRRTSGAARGTP